MNILVKHNNAKGILNSSLKEDIETGAIYGTSLIEFGMIMASPETWEIECRSGDSLVDSYVYASEDDYRSELDTLQSHFCGVDYLINLEKEELLDLIREYDSYLIECSDDSLGRTPVCIREFYDNEFQEGRGEEE